MSDGDTSRLGGADHFENWTNILNEYETLTGTVGYKTGIVQKREIAYLKAKIGLILMVHEAMEHFYRPEFKEILDKYLLRFEWELIEPEQYQSQLDRILTQVKLWQVQLKAKLTAAEEQEKKPEKDVPARQYFEEWLVGLSEHFGYNIDPNQITVYRFAVMVRTVNKKSQKKA